MLADLVRLARDWRPDAVVHEEGEYSAPLLATLEEIPCVTHSWPSPARPETERRIYRELLAPIWAANGVASIPRTSGDVYLDSCPPLYQSDEIGSVPGVAPIRPVLYDGPPTPVPPWLADLPRPAAYVTFGTVPAFSQPAVIRAAVEAIEPLVATVVVTTGPNPPDIVQLGSPLIHVAQYLAQSQILPKVDVVVSHGGAGTTLGALAHALPHLVMPGAAQSQQRNATRTEELGLGLHVPQDANVERVREAAERLLGDPSYRAAALAAQSSLEGLPSVEDRLRLIEGLRRNP
jgi:UDP:flavonoid glycosyltransferase YjiC (YdhE family)